jgi:E3 ubiquitin-protein ligase HUWE1
LNYLLNTLVPVGTLNHEGDLTFRKRLATSNCAIDVIVSLCHKTGEYAVPKSDLQQSPYAETEPDLLFVRKFVLEHALKAFRDANASDEPLDMRYSRLLNISDIFSRMVSQRSNGEMLTQNADLTPNLKQMAKIMYEKNFITILTTAISDIDLNFPNAKRVVKYILKPLKWLTYVAMDLSMHYDTSSAPDSADEYEISTASDDDLMDNTREETPDLFRNSTLGMFELPHNSESEDSDDEDGEEIMFDDPYADDMEYDEGDIGDNDEVISEDDEDMMEAELGEMGPIEGLPGDIEIEVEMTMMRTTRMMAWMTMTMRCMSWMRWMRTRPWKLWRPWKKLLGTMRTRALPRIQRMNGATIQVTLVPRMRRVSSLQALVLASSTLILRHNCWNSFVKVAISKASWTMTWRKKVC